MLINAWWKESSEFKQMPDATYQMQPYKPMQFGTIGSGECIVIL